MARMQRVSLKGTEHTPMPGARALGPTSPHQIIEISVILKHRQPLNLTQHRGQTLTHGDFARTYGADPTSVDKIKQFARENNLQVLERGDEVLRRTVTLAGTAADMEKAFSIELVGYEHPDGTYRSHTGPVQVPEAYAPLIQALSSDWTTARSPILTCAFAIPTAPSARAPQLQRTLRFRSPPCTTSRGTPTAMGRRSALSSWVAASGRPICISISSASI